MKKSRKKTIPLPHLKIVQSTHALIIRLSFGAFIVLVLLLVLGIGLSNLKVFLGEDVYTIITSEFFLLLLGFMLYLLLTAYIIIQWKSIYYEIYPKKIHFYSGILIKNERIVDLRDYGSANLSQGFLNKRYDYGTIELIGHRPGLASEFLLNIPHPKYYLSAIEEIL